ncbi:Inner membrane amino-acid ABC transporter permease protein YhdY [Marinomonas spartinae]|uniref:Inner membrane amino-acid ABC transporter permease protein YhdY n=1 Tax=Marinomonas spartinae TaxID=1792290 RepID=A0A1A8T063_9GAMM|nr:amino acid ABC transporter permease [Marinomonas spartinae]SBS24901.1 Inner membrane amino-acid ABC transporter permease protein YhdY [Marinomonas spartinae]SBS25280.1 Inner membrane amino-acid ABC transporter permease protein YhdY [Marinomonas spartinae]
MAIEFKPSPSLPPPSKSVGVVAWIRHNLLSSPLNVVLTAFSLYILYLTIPPLIEWGLINATWTGTSNKACTGGGACWAFINSYFEQFMYGFYPSEQTWRINLALVILVLLVAMFAIKKINKLYLALVIILAYPVLAYYLFSGGVFGLEPVETAKWGGLFLTVLLGVIGIVASFPLGALLALGRRSNMPVAKSVCVIFIESIRAVPLITILFMASVMIPLFLPEGLNFNKLLRVLIGIVLFSSAYMAEVIRGGLQAIPKGQYEAADAMGLSYWQSMSLIILPQALKLVIPGIVNTFIGLFKDTTLVYIVGMFDFLGRIQAANHDTKWLGTTVEGYVFAAFVYWIFCFGMSRYSMALERKLETGHKRN